MSAKLVFTIQERAGPRQQAIEVHSAIIAGWTGRDQAALEKHIRELEDLGVARPASTPIYYRVAASRLSQADAIEAAGGESSGEVEFVLVRHAGAMFIGVGSDHTDRKAETYNVTVSKQMCEKPIARELWPWEEVREHWDQLRLRSWVADGTLYQDGPVTAMRAPDDLIARYGAALENGCVMFCGTLAAIGGIRPSSRFAFELSDPVLGRSIAHAYDVIELPVLG